MVEMNVVREKNKDPQVFKGGRDSVMSDICEGFWEEVAFKMFLERWIGFQSWSRVRCLPVLDNSKVMRQVRAEHGVLGQWEKRENGRLRKWKAPARLLWGRGTQWQLPAGLGLSSAASPRAPPGLCV